MPSLSECGDVHDRYAEQYVGARVVLFCNEPRVQDAGGLAHPSELYVRISLAEAGFVAGQQFLLQ